MANAVAGEDSGTARQEREMTRFGDNRAPFDDAKNAAGAERLPAARSGYWAFSASAFVV
jgi:hypothetical protein